MRFSLRLLGLCALALLGGCSGPAGGQDSDASTGPADATAAFPDAAVPGPDAGAGPVLGGGCTQNSDCLVGGCRTTFPGGYCLTEGCFSTAACPAGSTCHEWDYVKLCLKACASTADCRGGYQCFDGACMPPCAINDDCGTGARCGAGGLCVRDATVTCAKDADCGARLCLLPEKVCTLPCFSRPDCPAGNACAYRPVVDATGARSSLRGLCVPPQAGAVAGASCGVDSECWSGFCHLGVCSESCHAGTPCPNNLVCVSSVEPLKSGFSRAVKVCMPAAGVSVWDTANRPVIDPFLAPVTDNTVSFTLVMTSDDTHLPIPVSLTAPDGQQLYVDTLDPFKQPVRFLPELAIGTMMVPITPLWHLQLGKGAYQYTTTVCDQSSSCAGLPTSTRVYYKFAPGAKVDTGKLALNFFFNGTTNHPCGHPVTAATAPSNADIQSILAEIRKIYGKPEIGITLGTIGYYDLNRTDLQTIDANSDTGLATLFATSSSMTGRAVNVFFIRGYTTMGLLGVAGGIPGPPVHGAARSGVSVGWESWCYGNILGNVVSHEVGHYLGLYHNIEQNTATGQDDPNYQDNIPDTDTSSANLMYWNEEGGEEVSAGQGFVMRNNYLVE